MIEKLERRTSTATLGDAESRVEGLTRGSDLTAVAVVLSTRRDEILARWLEVTGLQPFHAGRGRKAVADNIPALFDALVSLLQRSAPRWVDAPPPLDDPAVVQAAQAHAEKRFEQAFKRLTW
jgi:hypothetical protein